MPLEIGEELLKFQKLPRGKIIGFSPVYLPLLGTCQNIFFNTVVSDVKGLPGTTSAWTNPLLGFEKIIPPIIKSLNLQTFTGAHTVLKGSISTFWHQYSLKIKLCFSC